MKLVIGGASGFVATEIIRQSLSIPKITSVVAIARRAVATPCNLGKGADTSKFLSVVLDNYDQYSDDVKKQLAGADACIWTVAITPSKSKGLPFDEVRRVCQDYTIAGLEAMFEAHKDGSRTTFRFLYMSGAATERDQTKKPSWMPEYCLMRGETENRILSFAAQHPGQVEACVVKPGLITAPGQWMKTIGATALKLTMGVPSVDVSDIAAAMLKEAVEGFTKETLENADLVAAGRKRLEDDGS